MQNYPDQDDDSQPGRSKGAVWVAVAIGAVVVIIVVLHLTGAVGGSG